MLEFSTNKGEIDNKKSSIVQISKKLFRYKETDVSENNEMTKQEVLLQNLNDVLILSEPKRASLQKKPINRLFSLFLYVLMIVFLITSGLFGPFFLIIHIKIPILKLFWRQLLLSIISLPLCLLDIRQESSWGKICISLLAGILQAIWLVFYTTAIHYTSISHVYILTCLNIFFLTFSKKFLKKKLDNLEIFGIFLLIVVLVLVFCDRSEEFVFKGDLFALIGSLFLAVYLFIIDKYELSTPFWLTNFTINSVSSLIQFIILISFCNASFTLDEETGLFGLFSSNQFFVQLYIVILSGFGYLVFMRLIKDYFEEFYYRLFMNLSIISGTLWGFYLDFQGIGSVLLWVAIILSILSGILISMGKKSSEGFEFDLTTKEVQEHHSSGSNSIEMMLKE